MADNPYKRLASESAFYALGSVGGKLVLMGLLVLYTNYLSASEYGTVDLVASVVQLALPIVSLSVYDSTFRFIITADKTVRSQVLTNSILIVSAGNLVLALIAAVIVLVSHHDNELVIYGCAMLIAQAYRAVLSQFARGSGRMAVFAVDGLLLATVTGISGAFFLISLSMGIAGYFLSVILANVFSVIVLVVTTDALQMLRWKAWDAGLAHNMIRYSYPLIPNAVLWWLMSTSSRVVIVLLLGAGANGLFAVASRIPGLVTIFTSVFSQAWQVVSVRESGEGEHAGIYSNTFDVFVRVNLIAVSAVLVLIKPASAALFGDEFYQAWSLVPLLLFAAIFSNLSMYVGTAYITAKRTGGILQTSVVGGLANVILSFALIPFLGVLGAALSKCIASLAMLTIRVVQTRTLFRLQLRWRTLSILLAVVLCQTAVLYFGFSMEIEGLVTGGLFLLLLALNVPQMKRVMRALRSK